MILSDISVKRPVFATVISLLLIVFGIICYQRLPLREYPDIDSPIVSIKTEYTGASANVVETKVTQIIEDSVSGISGLKTIDSSSEDGMSNVTLEFNTNVNIEEAANDVRDKVGRVASKLPDEADSPRIYKRDTGGMSVMIMSLYHPDMSTMQLTDYADRNLVDIFSVVDGVSEVRIFGEKRYSMRIWLDRKALAAHNLTSADVENALTAENVELPAGRLESKDREFVMRLERLYKTPEEFRRLVLFEGKDGHLVRLGDVARIEVGPASTRDIFSADGNNAVAIGINKQSKANTLNVINKIKEMLPEIRKTLPRGMKLEICKDDSVFIQSAVNEVYSSLIISAFLVIAIIYLFLGSFRAALVPAVTVPISLIASFTVLYFLGYSINLLTLLALVLAIGLVVDDSIVVLENIHRRVENGEPPLLAAYNGAREVGFAVVATTLVLVAVFLPICLLEGNTGKLFSEFAVAIVAAVCFSSLVALTLSPVMCSRLLKSKDKDNWFAKLDEKIMGGIERYYEKMLRKIAAHPLICTFLFILFCGIGAGLLNMVPSEFEPEEDRAVIILSMKAPEGTGLNKTISYIDEVKKTPMALLKDGTARHVLLRVPSNHNELGAVNSGLVIMPLEYWDKRKIPAKDIIGRLYADTASIPGVKVFAFQPSGISSFNGQPVQFVIGGPTYEKLVEWRDKILEKARNYPGLLGVDSDYKETMPQNRIVIDRNRANKLGVPAQIIGSTLETMLGSKQVTTYTDNGEQYDVILQGKDEDRRTPTDMRNIYVRSSRTGKLHPLSNLVKIVEKADSGVLKRYNRVRSITISASVAPGHTLGECLKFMENTVRRELPQDAKINYKGMSKDFKESSSSMLFVFILAIVVVFLVLAAQFESYASPFVIMLTVPLGLLGALAGLKIFGATLNIYSQIGLIMLIGLAAKNGILIVEFANQLRDRGMEFTTAVFEASRLRLRPIAMTGLSTAIGALPLLFASGAGMESRICLGAVIFFGTTAACLLTAIVVPVGYLYLSRKSGTPRRNELKLKELAKNKQSAP
ncbi:MAG: multidrug transporter AcrB [Lentisphaerae bacterium GWF2_44_16]|nr:MAG: multidrug transporter AcrB [Lentisphaerae bacterium GWF2_44_16]